MMYKIIAFDLEQQRLPYVAQKEKIDIKKLNRILGAGGLIKKDLPCFWSSESQEEKEDRTEKVFVKIMAGNILNLLKYTDLLILEAERKTG